ncbi:MAG: cytochrome b/b6 domain-containing protein [Chloroflexota bacterium]
MRHTLKFNKKSLLPAAMVITGLLSIGLALNYQTTSAQSPLHPIFPFLDKNADNVIISGEAVSTMQTCGQCHDSTFIEEHSDHAQVGFDQLSLPGQTTSQRPWDTSPGIYGRWNPITYRYLSPQGDELIDLTTEEWLQTIGLRHVGGGPAEDAGVEMNCFLCHLSDPNNQARIETLQAGLFEWANTATLLGSGIVTQEGEMWVWNENAFNENGELTPQYIKIQDPDNENCAQCHGLVQDDLTGPLADSGCIPEAWTTQTTGQIISPQRLSDSGLNLANKDELSRSWDIHAERLVDCTDCHFSLNNPIYAEGSGADSLEHLEFDPRRLDIGEYLYQPLHQFASGQSTQSADGSDPTSSMRRCESCHNTMDSHDWLPYTERHMDTINCETCHIPQMYSTAIQQNDWTVINTNGLASTACRGVQENTNSSHDLITGYSPVLLQRQNGDGTIKLSPYNLVTAWFWVYGDPQRPERQEDLIQTWLDGDNYHAEIVAAFDSNQDGNLEENELVIDTPEKEALIASRLEALGLKDPHIVAEIQPYSINHDVTNGKWAISDCQFCHSDNSRITQPFQLANDIPGGVIPEFVKDTNVITTGEIYKDEDQALYYQPFSQENGLYILGQDNVGWVDWVGTILFTGTLLGVIGHGGLRVWSVRRRPKIEHKIKKIYMYSFYERLWHWLQTIAILILTFTGLVIHKPEMFGSLSFRGVVLVHNVLAGILVANAALALFYNLVSGEIKRFIPQPQGFFNQAIEQIIFYIRGIFKGGEHPFEKTREKRLNPLQKVTYFGILNVLLPLQILTGILMWGVQRWPETATRFGGLPFLAPFHTLVAWTFSAFIVAHVYLTTTGHTPMAGIKSMIDGWDEVEIHTHDNSPEEE